MEEYICPICISTPFRPLRSTCCKQLFCAKCVLLYNNSTANPSNWWYATKNMSPPCPLCRNNSPTYNYAKDMEIHLEYIKYPCPYGCGFTETQNNLRIHTETCTNNIGNKTTLKNHIHLLTHSTPDFVKDITNGKACKMSAIKGKCPSNPLECNNISSPEEKRTGWEPKNKKYRVCCGCMCDLLEDSLRIQEGRAPLKVFLSGVHRHLLVAHLGSDSFSCAAHTGGGYVMGRRYVCLEGCTNALFCQDCVLDRISNL